ncbi:DUF3667 domain-containing protein [Maricaulis sp.]|uniref:DUF3667 domain-containing protein n=1 Tax=Maricaulis sp. TaxID=1486257 RepID=UPI0026306461|nr:DUF3667 domain-containing protein [Maricaulis sp.]
MAGTDTSAGEREHCANCGAALGGPFCAQCGQAAEDIRRPAWHLLTDLVGSLFAWEGRFFTTLGALVRKPGQVARAYVDGRRNSYTAPVRIYLIFSLIFFVLMSLAGVRVVGVTILPTAETIRAQDPIVIAQRREVVARREAQSEDQTPRCGVLPGPDEIDASGQLVLARDSDIRIELFEFGPTPEGRRLPDDSPLCQNGIEPPGDASIFGPVSRQASTNPELFENRITTAATQSLLIMVIAYAGLNLLVHPRRRIIEHLIYSLYWHVPYLSIIATFILLGRFAGGATALIIALAALGGGGTLILQTLYDRGFYQSSWIGAIARSLFLQFFYIVCVGVVALALIIFSAG